MRPRSDKNENNNEVTEEKIEGRGKEKRKSHRHLIKIDFYIIKSSTYYSIRTSTQFHNVTDFKEALQ